MGTGYKNCKSHAKDRVAVNPNLMEDHKSVPKDPRNNAGRFLTPQAMIIVIETNYHSDSFALFGSSIVALLRHY